MIAAAANAKMLFNVVMVSGIILIVLRLLYFLSVVIDFRETKKRKEKDKLDIIESFISKKNDNTPNKNVYK